MQTIKADKVIGNNIRTLRKAMNLTQEEMAAKLQVGGVDLPRGTYAKVEAGIRNLSLAELREIRRVLGASWEDVLGV